MKENLEDVLARAARNLGGRIHPTLDGGYRLSGVNPELDADDLATLAARMTRHPAANRYLADRRTADDDTYGD